MRKILNLKSAFVTVCVLIVLASSGASFYFYDQYQKTQKILNDPTEAAKAEVKSLIARVGNLIILPNEEPSIATIVEPEKLKDQPFFAKAAKGDKVIIYTQAKKAILYRPDINKIIETAPITLGPTNGANVRIAIYNGTLTSGLTQTAETALKGRASNIEVVNKDNARRRDYDRTVVVDLAGDKGDVAKALAQLLNADVLPLPDGETRPAPVNGQSPDFLVILGKAFSAATLALPTPTVAGAATVSGTPSPTVSPATTVTPSVTPTASPSTSPTATPKP